MKASEIKELRLKLGLSQELLAHKLGVTLTTVNRWEMGHYQPLPLLGRKLIKLLKSTRG